MTPPEPSSDLMRYIAMLASREPAGGFLELRYRNPQGPGMQQHFHYATNTTRIARHILTLAEHSDVYIGVAPRRSRNGGRAAVSRSWVLWADIDTPGAEQNIAALPIAPGVIIRSGSAGHQHLYWPLTEPLTPADVEHANGTLAHALGADTGAVLGAATILRPPGTLNHKHTPPSPVTAERVDLRGHPAADILHGLPALERPTPPRETHTRNGSDPLLAIEPARYVEILTGQTVPRHRKIHCPLHEDSTPSLHVYEQPQNGWHCYGCNQGGTIYDLAAHVWGLGTRGKDFIQLRQRLTDLLLPGHTVNHDIDTRRNGPARNGRTATRVHAHEIIVDDPAGLNEHREFDPDRELDVVADGHNGTPAGATSGGPAVTSPGDPPGY
jgi:hypothetical protein